MSFASTIATRPRESGPRKTMFDSRPTEKGLVMAQDQQPNSDSQETEARPDDPDTNTSPRGNGEQDETDTERGLEKLDSVLGQ